jgi:hypothetical protein
MIEYKTCVTENPQIEINELARVGYVLHTVQQVIDWAQSNVPKTKPAWLVVMVREIVDEEQEAEDSHPEPMMTKG